MDCLFGIRDGCRSVLIIYFTQDNIITSSSNELLSLDPEYKKNNTVQEADTKEVKKNNDADCSRIKPIMVTMLLSIFSLWHHFTRRTKPCKIFDYLKCRVQIIKRSMFDLSG